MTELSFLLDLLMNHKLQKTTKEHVLLRIKEVEANLPSQGNYKPANTQSFQQRPMAPSPGQQVASTMALMMKHGDIPSQELPPPLPEPEPVEIIAQTPQTMAAMASRQQAIMEAISGKMNNPAGKPRKW